MSNQNVLWVMDEVRGRDKLIAWAYRYMKDHCHGHVCEDGSKLYSSTVLEFLRAAQMLVPDVMELACVVDTEADFAIKSQVPQC